jgi:hypothetical protein
MKIQHGDEHTFQKLDQPRAHSSNGANYSKQSATSTVPSPGLWKSRLHSSIGSLDRILNTTEC